MSSAQNNIKNLTGHLFRRESARIVSILTRIFGTENLEMAEDVVQDTLLYALQVWKLKGIPDNPEAWLFRVAKNKALDKVRRNRHSIPFDFSDNNRVLLNSGYTSNAVMEDLWNEEAVNDDLLKMMFASCHPDISVESQITLILKILCGFSTAEIARAFLTSEDTVSKRLYRAKEFFRERKIRLEIPAGSKLIQRTFAVLNALYLVFNEGYNSTHSEALIRRDLVNEARLLCQLLTENPQTQLPETFALMALICFHSSRFDSRISAGGQIILFPDQDRSKWKRSLIIRGNEYMSRAAFGDSVSSYHLEAAISFEHCTAESFEKTNWPRILDLYDLLCKLSPAPVIRLNRTVAVLELYGPEAALEALESIPDIEKLKSYYLLHSLLGEIHQRLHHPDLARQYFENGIRLTQSGAEKNLLRKKIEKLK